MHCATRITQTGGGLTLGFAWVQIEGPKQVARRSDMDMNGHINNVTYLSWVLETVPREVYVNYDLVQVTCLPNLLEHLNPGPALSLE